MIKLLLYVSHLCKQILRLLNCRKIPATQPSHNTICTPSLCLDVMFIFCFISFSSSALDPCANEPCENGGFCRPSSTNPCTEYTCECTVCFTGSNCQEGESRCRFFRCFTFYFFEIFVSKNNSFQMLWLKII